MTDKMTGITVLNASDEIVDGLARMASDLSCDDYQVQFSTVPLDDSGDDRDERAERIAVEITKWFERRGGQVQSYEAMELGLIIEAMI